MDMNAIKEQVRTFIANFTNKKIEDDTDIFSLGFANSLFGMQLVLFIERKYSVRLGPSEISLERLCNLKSIAKMVVELKDK